MVLRELPMFYLSAKDLGGGTSFGKNSTTSLPRISLESYNADFYGNRIQKFTPGLIIISQTTFSDNSVIVNQETRIELTKKDITVSDRENSKKRNKNIKIATILTTFCLSKEHESAFFANEEVDNVAKRIRGQINQDQEISAFIIYGVDGHNIIINLHPIKPQSLPESRHKKQKNSNKEEYYFHLDLGERSPHHDNDNDKPKDRTVTLQILDFYKCKKGTVKLRTGWKSKKAFESLLRAYIAIYPRVIAAIFQTYGGTIPEHIEFAFPQS